MNIPFRDVFEKLKARFIPAPRSSTPPPLPAPVDKPESDKLAKTVLPNAVRTINPEPATSMPAVGTRSRIAVGATSRRAGDLPPAVALALEPRVERVLSVALADMLDQMPEGYLKPRESFDTTRRVLLKAAEVEKGMAHGMPTLALSALYQQMPEIFMHSVPATDTSVVQLPFKKLLEELSSLRVRHDQTEEQIAQQYQTPFLQVTVEEAEKFGTKMEPVQVAEFPKVRIAMAPATAEAIAAAEPEPTAQEKFTPSHFGGGISSRQMTPEPPIAPIEKEVEPESDAELRTEIGRPVTPQMPFSLKPSAPSDAGMAASPTHDTPIESLPNGTGEPAFPRVPASSGPPVPPPSVPTRIPFKLTPESKPESVSLQTAPERPTAVPPQSEAPREISEPMVTLPLRPILESIPPMQIGGEVSSIPAETKISFPMTLIAPQLASGRVVVQPKDFHAALPPAHRHLFLPDAVDAPVQLSLPEVLANLPGDALQMRTDQEVVTQDEIFETPFSTKAAEDAKRFASEGGRPKSKAGTTKSDAGLERDSDVPKSTDAATAGPAQTIKFEIGGGRTTGPERKPEPATIAPEQTATIPAMPKIQPLVPAEPRFDAKEAILQASALPGVGSCSVIFADGLSIGGNIPPELHIDGLSAVAPTLLKKLEKHMLETQLGGLTCVTVHGQNKPVTFFCSGNICLTAVHSGGVLSAESRGELLSITEKLSRTYAQPGAAHVDH